MLVCLQILSISERLLQREVGLIKGIFACSITEQNLFELQVVIEVGT